MATRVQIIFYSLYGHVYRMAEAVAQGVREVSGAEATLYQVPELLPNDSRCALVQGDVRDAAAFRRVLHDIAPRAVCHLAALHFIPYCDAHPEEAMDVNVNGTQAEVDGSGDLTMPGTFSLPRIGIILGHAL